MIVRCTWSGAWSNLLDEQFDSQLTHTASRLTHVDTGMVLSEAK